MLTHYRYKYYSHGPSWRHRFCSRPSPASLVGVAASCIAPLLCFKLVFPTVCPTCLLLSSIGSLLWILHYCRSSFTNRCYSGRYFAIGVASGASSCKQLRAWWPLYCGYFTMFSMRILRHHSLIASWWMLCHRGFITFASSLAFMYFFSRSR
jgi:hypothetical protein